MPISGEYEIIKTSFLNSSAFEVWLDAPEIAGSAQPGQFVHILCGQSNYLRRPISICDVYDGAIRLVIGVRGEGTKWLGEQKAGTRLDMMGPLGRGFDLENIEGPVLLAGGGIGVPPLVYAARRLNGRAYACAGFSGRDSVMLIEDLSGLCKDVSLCTDDGSLGARGFVDKAVRRHLETVEFKSVLACGPAPMLKAVSALAQEFNVPCQVSVEERMGCGIGACLVCACKVKSGDGFDYKHVCKDGPVFDAREVIWDD